MEIDPEQEQCVARTFFVNDSWLIRVNLTFVYVLKKSSYEGMIDIILFRHAQNNTTNNIFLTLPHHLISSFGIYMNYCSPSDLHLYTFDPLFVLSSLCRFGVSLKSALCFVKDNFDVIQETLLQNFVSTIHASVVDVMTRFDNKESCKNILFTYFSYNAHSPFNQLKKWLLETPSINSSNPSICKEIFEESPIKHPKLCTSLKTGSFSDMPTETINDKDVKRSSSAMTLKQLGESNINNKGLKKLNGKRRLNCERIEHKTLELHMNELRVKDLTSSSPYRFETSKQNEYPSPIKKKSPRKRSKTLPQQKVEPSRITSVVVLQTRIRSYQSRKLYSLLLKRKECLLELFQTEQNLHKTMTLMNTYYRSSLLALNKDESFNKNVNQVFLTLPRCITSSALFISKLKEIMSPFNISTCIGDVLRMLITYVTPYLSFTTDYNIALATWKKLKTMPCVKQLIQKNSLIPELQTTTLELLLIQPVQRIMRYPMLIKEAFKATPRHHPDRSCLKKAYKEYHFFCKLANERSKMRDSLQEIALELDKDDLVVENRYHLLTLPLPTRRNVKVMLFNDMILLSKKNINNKPF
ncbi:Rho guanine nucleotide exchange factor [Entamoeba marina]